VTINPHHHKPGYGRILAIAVVAMLAFPAVWAAEWYRYVDDNGVLVMSHTIPPDLVHKGYQVLDGEGSVIRVVERQPTAAEIAAREAARAREEAAEQERQARQRRDEELLVLYASPEDVQFARERRLASIDNSIRMSRANIERLQNHKRQLEIQAAGRERSGQSASQDVLENIRIIDLQIRESEREIASREREKAQADAQFDSDYARTRELYGILAASD
jgi:hypothetical protein